MHPNSLILVPDVAVPAYERNVASNDRLRSDSNAELKFVCERRGGREEREGMRILRAKFGPFSCDFGEFHSNGSKISYCFPELRKQRGMTALTRRVFRSDQNPDRTHFTREIV